MATVRRKLVGEIGISSFKAINVDTVDSALFGHFGPDCFCPNKAEK